MSFAGAEIVQSFHLRSDPLLGPPYVQAHPHAENGSTLSAVYILAKWPAMEANLSRYQIMGDGRRPVVYDSPILGPLFRTTAVS